MSSGKARIMAHTSLERGSLSLDRFIARCSSVDQCNWRVPWVRRGWTRKVTKRELPSLAMTKPLHHLTKARNGVQFTTLAHMDVKIIACSCPSFIHNRRNRYHTVVPSGEAMPRKLCLSLITTKTQLFRLKADVILRVTFGG